MGIRSTIWESVNEMYNIPGPSPSCSDLLAVVGEEDNDTLADELFAHQCEGGDTVDFLVGVAVNKKLENIKRLKLKVARLQDKYVLEEIRKVNEFIHHVEVGIEHEVHLAGGFDFRMLQDGISYRNRLWEEYAEIALLATELKGAVNR